MASTQQRGHTVFLTPEEDQRVRTTLNGRLQKCEEFAGQPRVAGDSKSLLSQLTGASLLSDFSEMAGEGKSGQDTMSAFAVGQPYPPCTVLLKDLETMKLSDLCMNKHHRGRVLNLRRKVAVLDLAATSWTVVEDESGETERLEILLHKSNHGQDILESGSTYKLKEPYFTFNDQGEPTLRVDHPSDLVICTENQLGHDASKSSTAPESSVAKTAREFKEEGNAALKEKGLLLAHAKYSQGLQLIARDGLVKEDLAYDLFRNRAHVNIALNRFDEAKADALRSVSNLDDHKELDSKAYFRAGSAAYELGEYLEAKKFFEKQQMLKPGDRLAMTSLSRVNSRLQEQATGVYNFKKIGKGLSMASPRADASSFNNNVKVGESHGQGRGLFATRTIDTGEIVLCEKAFRVVWGHHFEALTAITYDGRDEKIRVIPAGLDKAIVEKLRDNPSQVERIMDLYGDYRSAIGNKLILTDDSTPVVDTFQIRDIVARNAFGPGQILPSGEDVSSGSAGLWVLAAYINHSCIPNAKKEFIGDLMILRATRKIAKGEEISHSYDESTDYDTRATALMNTWGFQCSCALCIVEKADDPIVRKRRRELESEANEFVASNSPIGTKRLTIVSARRLARAIDDTYDGRYKDLPRTALLGIQNWLAGATTK